MHKYGDVDDGIHADTARTSSVQRMNRRGPSLYFHHDLILVNDDAE